MRESIKPMKNVNASSSTTPTALLRKRWIANIKPNATTMKTRKLLPGLAAITVVSPAATPIHAPSTVGIIDSASRRYVLRSTLLRACTVVTPPARLTS